MVVVGHMEPSTYHPMLNISVIPQVRFLNDKSYFLKFILTLQISIDYFLFIVYHSVHVLKFTKNTYITKERRFSLQKSYKRYLAPLIQHRLYGTRLQKRNHMTALAPSFYPLMLCCTLFLICISLLDY